MQETSVKILNMCKLCAFGFSTVVFLNIMLWAKNNVHYSPDFNN
jgi:hypothetical protein